MAKIDDTSGDESAKTGKKQQTVRERTLTSERGRKLRVRRTAGKVINPAKKVANVGKKEYHLPLPDNKLGRVLRKRVRLFPRFVVEAWRELRQVTWPNARETVRLTMAVFIFSVIFAAIVGALDFGLDKLFREVIVGK